MFCALPGARFDGHEYAEQAKSLGAIALLVEREVDVDLPQFVVENTRRSMATFACSVHGNPSDELSVVGVTGTNGKSSFVQILRDIWLAANTPSETYGTVSGARTTPESTDLQRMLRSSVNKGCSAVAMEVSSHALTLDRVLGTSFSVAVFTNLGRDHLDFHGDLERYFEAKASLFTQDYTTTGVVNLDDEYGRRLADESTIQTIGYQLADAEQVVARKTGSSFRWRGVPVELHLAGEHNLSNALAAAATAECLGISVDTIADGLCATSPVRGRFEFVDVGQPFSIAVDYAHTPDALEAALGAARSVSEGRVIVVFGCGGDRDHGKRPEMGRVAERLADRVILTSDNPRNEDPQDIADAILDGFSTPSAATYDPDRFAAITLALHEAGPGDLVLVAGKGHETEQIVGDVSSHFDDREAVIQVLGAKS